VSSDGARWLFVRHFALEGADGLLVGFEAQSPTGPGCAVTFTDIDFSDALGRAPRRLVTRYSASSGGTEERLTRIDRK
jgi:hypothetical protein